jgi:hypothetical protein
MRAITNRFQQLLGNEAAQSLLPAAVPQAAASTPARFDLNTAPPAERAAYEYLLNRTSEDYAGQEAATVRADIDPHIARLGQAALEDLCSVMRDRVKELDSNIKTAKDELASLKTLTKHSANVPQMKAHWEKALKESEVERWLPYNLMRHLVRESTDREQFGEGQP